MLIQGAGPLGLFSTAMAVNSGSSNVIVLGAPAARLLVAQRWGAHHTIDLDKLPDADDRREQVLALTGGRGADVVIETDVRGFELTAFTRAKEMAAVGEGAALEQIPQVRRLLSRLDPQLFPAT